MRLLVLGGTGFVGRHIVEGARGDETAGARAAAPVAAEPVWVSDERLVAAGLDLPLQIAAANAGLMAIDGSRAVAAGLRHRLFTQTAADTAAALRPQDGPGLDPAREARLVRTCD